MTSALRIAVLALLLAGCAAPAMWHRADTDADQAAFDLQTCRSQARGRLRTHQYFAQERAAADARAADQAGRADGSQAIRERWAEARDRQTTGELIAECMAAKGYKRGPAPTPARAA